MNKRKTAILLTAYLALTAAAISWPTGTLAAQRVRPSGRSFSGRSSGSMRGGARTSGSSRSYSGSRGSGMGYGGSRMSGGRSMMRSPSVRVGGTTRYAPPARTTGRSRVGPRTSQRPTARVGRTGRSARPGPTTGRSRVRPRASRRPPVRVGRTARPAARRTVGTRGRVRPTALRRPTVRDPRHSVGRTTHRIRRPAQPYDRSGTTYPYYPWRPYYTVPLRTHYDWYWYHRPFYSYSSYRPRWWYPYYDTFYPYYGYGGWWWNDWGMGASFSYSPSYDYSYASYEPAVTITERVVDSGTPAGFTSPDSAEADRLFDDGRYSEAAEMYRQLSFAHESDVFVRLAHAHCLLADGRYEYAAYVVRKAAGLDPDWEQIFMQLRGHYGDWGIYVDQVTELEQYIAEKPDNTAARFLLGYAYLFWDRYGDAAGVFRSLLARQPEDNGVRYFLGTTESLEKRGEASS